MGRLVPPTQRAHHSRPHPTCTTRRKNVRVAEPERCFVPPRERVRRESLVVVSAHRRQPYRRTHGGLHLQKGQNRLDSNGGVMALPNTRRALQGPTTNGAPS